MKERKLCLEVKTAEGETLGSVELLLDLDVSNSAIESMYLIPAMTQIRNLVVNYAARERKQMYDE